MHKILIAILFALLLGNAVPVFGQGNKERDEFKVDSVLYEYLQRCREKQMSPEVIPMCDTLFEMSEKKGDQRMQAVALATKLDYYYFNGLEDGIIAHVAIVKEFAKKTGQPKYYYFVWGSRLIQYYIKCGRLATAMYEAEKMLRDAQESDDKQGLATCYNVIGTIYKARGMPAKSFENRKKEIELIETYNLDKYNLANAYHDLASYYLSTGDTDAALKALEKSGEYGYTSFHKSHELSYYIDYYIKTGDNVKAAEYLRRLEELYASDKHLNTNIRNLYDAQYGYYTATGNYAKALEINKIHRDELGKRGEDGLLLTASLQQAHTLYRLGRYGDASNVYRNYIAQKDSLEKIVDQNSASEFAALLGVEKLNNEKRELALNMREDRLIYTYSLIAVLVLCLAAVFVLLYRERRSNRMLKVSEANLTEKNNKLIVSEEQLRHARDRAEKASAMKSAFMQNMTHEIRTPLNSIVGFSDLIVEMLDKDSPAREFSAVIRENNNRMLKLIDDVLDMSALDSGTEVELHPTDINQCCQDSVKNARSYAAEGVTLEFNPHFQPFIAMSNAQRLSQILFNLLQNAARATGSGSIKLAYELSPDRAAMIFTVTDTGYGIPADKAEYVFERFVKLNDYAQGFGLGLSVSRLLARKMGGDLTADPGYAGGCRMILTLPNIPARMDGIN